MRLTFVSNYFNHHQKCLCDAFFAAKDVTFTFLQTEPMEAERVRMGWGEDLSAYPYVKDYATDKEEAAKLVLESDAVIFGGVDDESYIEKRLEAGRLTLRYSERIYKEGQWKFISPRGLKKKYHDHVHYRKAPVYLLCAGAYVASDFSLIHAYPKKKYVWGYFPEVISYSEEELRRSEGENLRLLWSGRMIDWKHPEAALLAARFLKEKSTPFHLTMAGGGELEESLKRSCAQDGLTDCVEFTGFLKPEEIRRKMLEADIYLFTSDYREGWGAVLNESMNSGCAVIASHAIGAVPYLMQHGRNGLVYRSGDSRELCRYVGQLALDPPLRQRLGMAAYETMQKGWRADMAAERLLGWLRAALENGEGSKGESAGAVLLPMQEAPLISPRGGYRFTRR